MNAITLKQVENALRHASPSDRRQVRHRLKPIRRALREGGSDAEMADRLKPLYDQLRRSARRRQERIRNRPRPASTSALPIHQRRNDIIDAIRKHPVVVISGETGSGKTTQIPQYCLEAGRGIDGIIGCTQPRRIAATSVAKRIADELGEPLGQSVGYKIRFRENVSRNSYLKIMTDGILLAETQSDPGLYAYDTLIVDEAHERSINIDFILGLLHTILQRRRDLKVIITSATIDTAKFSAAFGNAPVIEVSGRMYPVEVEYRPPESEDNDSADSHVEAAAAELDRLIRRYPAGDVLVFMPTEQGIRETCDLIAGRGYRDVTVLPLFARLSGSAQSRVFARTRRRKIVVATNIAETSITIPGIRFVIDTGLARISQYQPRSRTTALPVTRISRSSADQRMGRCGRVENGTCIRLYGETDYQDRPQYTPPEILRANLAEVVLRMIALNLGNVEEFPFIDPPAPQRIRDGLDLLVELGAVTRTAKRGRRKKHGNGEPAYRLTPHGRLMARIPVDPRLSRMLIEAGNRGCLEDITILAAALSIPDPRERPPEKEGDADAAHAAFRDPFSDFVTLLNIWRAYHHRWDEVGSLNQVKKWCVSRFLSFKRMREWRDLHHQLRQVCKEHNIAANARRLSRDRHTGGAPGDPSPRSEYPEGYGALHRCILTGFLSNIATRKEARQFQAGGGKQVMIHPGSGLFAKPPSWVVAAEMVETSRLFARTCAAIDPRWLEILGNDLCRRAYHHPRWERKREAVVADEQVTLFGLIIVTGRKTAFGPVDPDTATAIFIRDALVAGDVRQPPAFMRHNRRLMDDASHLEDRIRRRDVLVSPEDMADFYRRRLENVYDMRTLRRCIRRKDSDAFLHMQPEDVRRYTPDPDELDRYPDRIAVGHAVLPCTYRFAPGHGEDGLTVHVPSTTAASIPPEPLQWLVPGLLREKVDALLRSLPKAYRRRLSPVSHHAEIIGQELRPDTGRPLLAVLGDLIRKRFGVDIPASAWSTDTLPAHLIARIDITGPNGETVASSRDPAVLRRHTTPHLPGKDLDRLKAQWERSEITPAEFPDLPDDLTVGNAPEQWTVFPALMVDGTEVAIRLVSDPRRARRCHRQGVDALFRQFFSTDLKYLNKRLKLPQHARSLAAAFGGPAAFEEDLFGLATREVFSRNIRSADAFHRLAEALKPGLMDLGQDLLQACLPAMQAYTDAVNALAGLAAANRNNTQAVALVDHLTASLRRLIPEQFIRLYEIPRIERLPRYARATVIRAQRGVVDPEKDRQKADPVNRHEERLQGILETITADTSADKRDAVEGYFWSIEEFKISVFAQELGTREKVSDQRLNRQAEHIDRMV